MNVPRAVIFDVDGTLVNSNDSHAYAWVDALKAYGLQIPFARVRPLVGLGADKLLPELTGFPATSLAGRKVTQARSEIFRSRYLPVLEPFPCVRELLMRIIDHGMQPAVATSSNQTDMEHLLEVAGVADLLPVRVSAEAVRNTRPAPDLLLMALTALRAPAASAVVVGDTPYDVTAAKRAGMSAIAFRCGGWNDDGLMGAAAVYEDPRDLLVRFDDSPLAGVHREPTTASVYDLAPGAGSL